MNRDDIEAIFSNQEMIRAAEKEEPRFLCILLKDKDRLSDAIASGFIPVIKNKPGHFIIPRNNLLYTLIYRYYLKYHNLLTRSAIDSIIDMQEIGSEEEKSFIKTYWDEIWRRPDATIEDYEMLKDRIHERFVFWQWIEVFREGNKIISSNNGYLEKIKEFQTKIANINSSNIDIYSKIVPIQEGIEKALEFIEKRRNNPNDNNAIPCGIKGIDKIFNGFERGTYTVISGMINGGKTTLMFNMGLNMAKMGYGVAYVSLEKKAELFFRRILCVHAGVDYNRIKRGGSSDNGINDFWYNKVKQAAKDLNENIKPNYTCLQYVQETKLSKILSDLDRLRNTTKIDVLFVDYLQVIGVETSHPTRPDLDLAEVHRRLMAYGRQHNIVVFTALQLKSSSAKDIRNKAKKISSGLDINKVEVNPEDYSGSQLVVADADNAIGVVLNADHPSTKMYINISKARDDTSKISCVLDFDGKIGRVSDPIVDPNQILHVDQLLYAEDLDENKLKENDDLFDGSLPPPTVISNTPSITITDAMEPPSSASILPQSNKPIEKTENIEEKEENKKSDSVSEKIRIELNQIEIPTDQSDDDELFRI